MLPNCRSSRGVRCRYRPKLDTALQKLDGTYEYNLEQKELTLTEREYGSQMTIYEKIRNRQRRWMQGEFLQKNFSSAVKFNIEFFGRTGGKKWRC